MSAALRRDGSPEADIWSMTGEVLCSYTKRYAGRLDSLDQIADLLRRAKVVKVNYQP